MDQNAGFLALNAGSSSLKVALFPATGDEPLVTGQAERIGPEGTMKLRDAEGNALPLAEGDLTSHAGALAVVIATVKQAFPDLTMAAVGHRVVHGGLDFSQPVLVDEDILRKLSELEPFAPLHQPHNIAGIRAAMAAFPGAPQVACFDTAFHRGQPFVNDTFAIPHRYYEAGVRRYGFHGLSYDYVTGELERIAPHLMAGRVVVAHLGNGASMCAIYKGKSVASSMGFSALDGLPMGTRCGQIDPGVLLYMLDREGMDTPRSGRFFTMNPACWVCRGDCRTTCARWRRPTTPPATAPSTISCSACSANWALWRRSWAGSMRWSFAAASARTAASSAAASANDWAGWGSRSTTAATPRTRPSCRPSSRGPR